MQARFQNRRYAVSSASNFRSPAHQAEVFHIGDLSVYPEDRVLLRNGTELRIGSRAFDLLVVLLEARGKVVEKRHIQQRVWPSTTVDDCNIRFQISSLRKVLEFTGASVKTVPGRGYLLTVGKPEAKAWPTVFPFAAKASSSFPEWLSNYDVGRGEKLGAMQYVALVDDDPLVLESMTGLIESAGFQVAAFPDLATFLQSTSSCPPRCLVLDAWLPDRRGLDFQDELRSAGIRLPIVFISGAADIAMSVRAMKAGAYDFLTKPVRHDDLLNAIGLAMANPVQSGHFEQAQTGGSFAGPGIAPDT